jgi:CRISPR-associated protein Csm3
MATEIKKIIKKIKIESKIHCLSGLKIGGSISPLSIGGIDAIIIRNPKDNKPYIPGSSLKGKLRSLLEIARGEISINENNKIKFSVSDKLNSISCRLFGRSSGNKSSPSRVIVRDAHILNDESDFPNTLVPFAEIKTEVTIDRVTSAATPRTIERVPAGAEFSFELILNIFNFKYNDKNELIELSPAEIPNEENELLENLLYAMQLLQNDYLGGNGSRGYGNIYFKDLTLSELNISNNEFVFKNYNTSNERILQLLNYFKNQQDLYQN